MEQTSQIILGSSEYGIHVSPNSIQIGNQISPVTINKDETVIDIGNYTINEGSQQLVSKGYVDTQINALVDDAPLVLDSLREIAQTLDNNPNIITDLQTQLNTKLTLNDIQSNDLDINNNQIQNLKDGEQPQDAVTKKQLDEKSDLTSQTSDIVFVKNNQILQTIDETNVVSNVNLNMQHNLIYNVSTATTVDQPMTYGQSLQHQWVFALLGSDITAGFLPTFIVPFDLQLYPGLINVPTGATNHSGILVVNPGKYIVNFALQCEYKDGTDEPVRLQLASVQTGVYPYLNVQTNRAHNLNTPVYTNASTIIDIQTPEQLSMQLSNTQYLARIDRNTQLQIIRIA